MLGAVVWLAPSLAHANPDWRMRTLETEHFHIHYYAGEEEIADRVGMLAERAYQRVTVLLAHEPFLKTHVFLTDDTDFSNGFANAIPYPAIRLYASAPGSMSVLGTYDDWIDILVTHEFVHVVHIDTVHGLPRLLNALLGFGVVGKVTGPNIVQPRWMVEGLATMYESDLTSAGRHRSGVFDMFMRMAIMEGRFQAIDQTTNSAKVFPHASSVYLYGLHLMHYIAARYGREKLAELSHIYGGRLIPFGINRAVEEVIGVDFDQLWKEYKIDTERRFGAQIRQIRARGVRQGRRLTFSVSNSPSGAHTRFPRWSAGDDWVYFYEDDGHRQPGIYRVPAEGGPVREGIGIGNEGMQTGVENVLEIQGGGMASFVGATQQLVHDMLARHDLRYSWSDLYLWKGGDPRSREQLTFGLRAREPHVSPDGREVVFVRADTGQTRLGFLDLDTRDVVEVAPLGRLQQIQAPRFSPDGRQVAFSMWREGGERDIYVYDRDSGHTRRITADRYMDQAPTWTPDGRYIVFSSDRTGVVNLHAFDTQTQELWQVTNVFGGAFEPEVSHDGRRIAYVNFASTGFDVWVMEWDPERFLPALPASDALPAAQDPTPELPGSRGRPPTQTNSHRYRPLQTFFPRTVFPTALEFESTEDFLTALGLTSELRDIAGFHSAIFSFSYLTDLRRAAGSVSYTFSRLFPSFNVAFGRGYTNKGGFERFVYDGVEGEEEADQPYRRDGYLERATLLRGTMSLPAVSHPRHNLDATIGYQFARYENVDAGLETVDPNAPTSDLPEVGDIAQVDLGLTYSSQQSFRYSYGVEVGRRLTTSLTIVDEKLGGDFGDLQVQAFYTEMIPMPWRGHQVLAFRLSTGASARGLSRRGAFFKGGFGSQQDQIRTLLVRAPWYEGGVLRGYPRSAFGGNYYAVLNTEYRVPIVDIDRGLGSLPLLFEKVVLAGFTDWGSAWSSDFSIKDLVGSVGASLILGARVGYGERITMMLQYAHGFDEEEGIEYFRAIVARSF